MIKHHILELPSNTSNHNKHIIDIRRRRGRRRGGRRGRRRGPRPGRPFIIGFVLLILLLLLLVLVVVVVVVVGVGVDVVGVGVGEWILSSRLICRDFWHMIRDPPFRTPRPEEASRFIKGGVQWKQGVVVYMMLYTSLLYDTTPIRCTPFPLHPPVMNTQRDPPFRTPRPEVAAY